MALALFVIGATLVVTGVALMSHPLAVLIAGVFVLLAAVDLTNRPTT